MQLAVILVDCIVPSLLVEEYLWPGNGIVHGDVADKEDELILYLLAK